MREDKIPLRKATGASFFSVPFLDEQKRDMNRSLIQDISGFFGFTRLDNLLGVMYI